MRGRMMIVAIGILIVAIGGGYYGLQAWSRAQFRAALDQRLAALPAGMTASYKTAEYDILSHRAEVKGLTMHIELPGQPPQQVDIAIDAVEFVNPNLKLSDEVAKASATPATATPDTAVPAADAIEIKGVTIHSSLISLTLETVRYARPRLYPWAFAHSGSQTWAELTAPLAQGGTSMPSAAAIEPLLRAEAAGILAVGYDGYEVGPVKGTETLPGIDVTFAIHGLTSGGFERGVMKAVVADGVSGSSNAATFAIDRLTIDESDFREPLTRVAGGEALSLAMLNGMRIGRIDYGAMTMQLPGQPATRMGGFSIGPVAFAQGMPVSGKMAWRDVVISKAQVTDPKAKAFFDQLGLDTATTSFALAYDWDLAQKHISVHDTMLKINELGLLTLSADLSNVEASVAASTQVRLAHARLRFEDASLTSRLLRQAAAQSGADPDMFRRQIELELHTKLAPAGQASPILSAAGAAVANFIELPHSLTIELSPPSPLPFADLQAAAADPSRLAAALGLSVVANQP